MDTHCPNLTAKARRIESNLMRALAKVGNQAVADAIGKDESVVSRWKSEGKFAQTAQVLDALGLKVVAKDAECYRPEFMASLRTLARMQLAEDAAPTLEWE